MKTRREVEEAIASCTACHLASPTVAPVPFRGPTPAVAAIVAEAPGKVENHQGRPLIGPAGQLLDNTLEKLGMDVTAVCYLNVVSCFPGRTPAPDEIAACNHHFRAQLEVADPQYVLLLGNVALQTCRPDAKIMATRGEWWEEGGRKMMAALHPAAILRNEQWKPMFEEDLRKFVERVQAGT